MSAGMETWRCPTPACGELVRARSALEVAHMCKAARKRGTLRSPLVQLKREPQP